METKESTCPICLESLSDKTIGSPDICDHKFCLACLEKWAKHGNFCPVDKQKFKTIISGDEVIQIKFKRKKRRKTLYDMTVNCEICKENKEGNETVILCDTCDLAYHLDCLNPPLKSIPAGNWDCPDCKEVSQKKKLKSQKTKDGKKAHKASTNSKRDPSLFPSRLISPTKQTGFTEVSSKRDQNASIEFPKTKYNPVKQSSFLGIDYCQKKYSCTETVNSSNNCTETRPEEFEDFFNVSDNGIILTKRKPLNTEGTSFNKNFGREFWPDSNVDFQLSRQVKNTSYNSSEAPQTERKTKRLAAAIASNKIYQNLKKMSSDDSFEQFSVSENNSLGSAALSTRNHFADIKKSALSHQSCTYPHNNKNATNYQEDFSLSKPKSVNEMGLEGKNTLIENLNKNAASKSKCETVTKDKSSDSVRSDFLCASETASWKASPTNQSTKKASPTSTNDSQGENLNNARIQAMSESFNHMNVSNYYDEFSLSKPKSVNGMGLKSHEEKSRLIKNLKENAASKSFSIDNSGNFTTFSGVKPTNLVEEDLNRTEFICAPETTCWKAFPTSTEVNNSEVENLNHPLIYRLKSFNNKNITNYTDKFSLFKPKSVNEMGLEGSEGKHIPMENLNENTASKSSSIDFCENFATFTNVKSPGSISKDDNGIGFLCASKTAGWTVSPLKTKVNNSLAVMLDRNEILEMPKSLGVSKEPDDTSIKCKSLHVKGKSPNKRTRTESCETNSSEDSRVLTRKLKLNLTETRTKRLAAANAIKKLTESFKSSSEESSGDESSDSLEQRNVSRNDDLEKTPLKSNNHYLFEKATSHQNSPLRTKNDEDSTSEFFSDSESPEGIEKNIVKRDFNRRGTSPIPKVSSCSKEDFNRIECLSVFEKPSCKASATIVKVKNSVAEELGNEQIQLESESFSISKKPEIVEPPELTLEPLKTPLKLGNEIPPELTPEPLKTPLKLGNEIPPDLLIEPLKVMRRHGNKMLPIAKENEIELTPSVVGDWKNGSSASTFNVFEKVTDTSVSAEKQSSRNRTTNGNNSHMEGCENVNNLQNDVLSQEKDNSSDIDVVGEENILDSFHIRQVHYAIKAKMNLRSELQKIEQETWMSCRSKSSRKYKYKSSRNEAEIHTSSSHHQVVSGNEQLYRFFQSSHLDCNKTSNIKKDLEEGNKFNPFCESLTSTRPKKQFKMTEYKLEPADKQFSFNKIPKNVLQSFMGPYSVGQLDMREDGSLFLNWARSKSQ